MAGRLHSLAGYLVALALVTSRRQDGVMAQALNGNDLIGLLSSLASQGGGGGGGGGVAANLLQQLQTSGAGGQGALSGLAQYLTGLGPQAGQGPYPPGQYGAQGPYPQGAGLYGGAGQQYPFQRPRPVQRPYPGGPGIPPGPYTGGYGQYPPPTGALGHYPGGQRPYPGGPGPFAGGPGPYLPNPNGAASFTDALTSIAQYDDLRCVPRLLCEVASGGRPTYGKQESIVPFVSKDTLLTLLTVLNFADSSPLFAFGRAALLGVTARGDPSTCFTAYPTCPRDPDTLVNYLNNHNGGFFRFFNQRQHNQQQYAPQYAQQYGKKQQKYGLQKYTPQKYVTQQQYGSQQQYATQQYAPQQQYDSQQQYATQQYAPQQQYDSQQQYATQQQYNQQYPHIQQRIQNVKHGGGGDYNQYVTTERPRRKQNTRERDESSFPPYSEKYYATTPAYNPVTSSKEYNLLSDRDRRPTLRFPRADDSDVEKTRGPKSISFPEFEDTTVNSYGNAVAPYALPMVFPDRTGTGDLRLDTDQYGNTVIFSVSDTGFKADRLKNHEEILFGKGTSLTFPNEFGSYRKQRDSKYTISQSIKFPQYRSYDRSEVK